MNIDLLSRGQSETQKPEEGRRTAEPPRDESDEVPPGEPSTPDYLLRRICRKRDFPAMSAAISAINRDAMSDTSHIQHLSNSILRDFALTSKILRVANSALYRRCGAGEISTISRAIVVLGFDAVRHIALSLMLLEQMRNKQHADALIEDFAHAAMSGVIGKHFATAFAVEAPERSFICALLHNLGRLLTHCYLPEETQAVAKLMAQEQCEEEAAVLRTLNMSYEDLGIGIAKDWGFPDIILHSMKRLPPGKVAAVHSDHERLRVLSTFANEVASVFQNCAADARQREVRLILKRHADNVQLVDQDLNKALKQSLEEITELLHALGIDLQRTRLGKKLGAVGSPDSVTTATDSSNGSSLPASVRAKVLPDADPAAAPVLDSQAVLTAGIQDISHALAESDSMTDVLRIILETMYRGMGCKRVLLCLRNGATGTMSARFGFGAYVEESLERFRFPLGGRNDIFNIILASDRDVLINDVLDPKIAPLIPDWFKLRFPVQTFIVFPLRIKGAPVAMIYVDKDYADSIAISDKELPLLRTLCNQAVLAIRQMAHHS